MLLADDAFCKTLDWMGAKTDVTRETKQEENTTALAMAESFATITKHDGLSSSRLGYELDRIEACIVQIFQVSARHLEHATTLGIALVRCFHSSVAFSMLVTSEVRYEPATYLQTSM